MLLLQAGSVQPSLLEFEGFDQSNQRRRPQIVWFVVSEFSLHNKNMLYKFCKKFFFPSILCSASCRLFPAFSLDLARFSWGLRDIRSTIRCPGIRFGIQCF